jgi:hypothetical protein
LDKFQFLTQEFRKTNVLVPGADAAVPVDAQVSVSAGGNRPVSAYVSIIFDLAAIIHNLWPGHQFQYLPALARDIHDDCADLYYSDWIHTTGDLRGALMCCPGKWEEQTPPAFGVELPEGESLLKKQTLLKVCPKDKNRAPYALFGHDWKLLVTAPKGENLPPLALTVAPASQSFVAAPAPLQEQLRQVGAPRVKARIVGHWGFTSLVTDPFDLPTGCDPEWVPSPKEVGEFGIGRSCTFTLPGSWASVVEQVVFRSAKPGATPLLAKIKNGVDGSREAVFTPKPEDAGPGTLEVRTYGCERPALSRPLTLARAPVEVAGVEARLGETGLVLRGRNLSGVQMVVVGGRRFLAAAKETGNGAARDFQAEDGKMFEGEVGMKLPGALVTMEGQSMPLPAIALMEARPRLGEVRIIPMEGKGTGLPITSTIPIAPTGTASQVSIFAGKGYRFPADRAFRAAIRNAEEPTETRLVGPAKIRIMGNNQKATFSLNPSDLLGGRASGKLEIQIQDDHAGASAWLPIPATFLDLPTIAAIQGSSAGYRLTGPSLDQIEAVAPAPEGPWEKAGLTIVEGYEVVTLGTPLPAGKCCLRLFGWADLPLTVRIPEAPVMPLLPAGGTSLPATAKGAPDGLTPSAKP